MGKVVVDASVFISSVLKEELNSKTSQKFFRSLVNENTVIVVTLLTLFEVLHGFYRTTRDSEATEFLNQYFISLNVTSHLKILNLDAAFLAHFLSNHENFDIKTSDAVVALTALRENCPLISWDKQMLKAASKKVETFTPAEWLERA